MEDDSMLAYLFPGQGSQYVGMCKEEHEFDPKIRLMFDSAERIMGRELRPIMFYGPKDELMRTEQAQPAVFLHSYGLLEQKIFPRPDMLAGHSLGEYTALVAAGSLTLEDALRVIDVRARAMAKAELMNPGGMAAVIGLSAVVLDEICQFIRGVGDRVWIANFNSPEQLVVSGTKEGISQAGSLAKRDGARVINLPVSGAFHTPLMESALPELTDCIERTRIRNAEVPVYMNIDGEPRIDSEDIKRALLDQLTNPVLWVKTICNMKKFYMSEYVEIGPGNVLRGFMKRILPGQVSELTLVFSS
jgi:[acyl-carrier-protein] S-malonyltransferase